MARVKTKKSEIYARAFRNLLKAIMPDEMTEEEKEKELKRLTAEALDKASVDVRKYKRPDLYLKVVKKAEPVVEEPVEEPLEELPEPIAAE